MTVAIPHQELGYSETALTLPASLPFDEWVEVGHTLSRIDKAVHWWLGDWWRYGEHSYGERAAQAVSMDGFAFGTLMNDGWVAGVYPPEERRPELTFSHHRIAAPLGTSSRDEVLARAAAESWSVRELEQQVRQVKAAALTRELVNPVPAPDETPTAFATIVIDPPWQYGNKATRGAAEDHYPTMTQDELIALELPAEDDAHLYLWVTNNFLRDGLELCEAWGFAYKTMLTWVKPQMGMGNYFRSVTEHVLFGVRGSLPTLRNDRTNVISADRKRHSAKPEAFYDLVAEMSPGPYLEMFARQRRMGWHTWGNEA